MDDQTGVWIQSPSDESALFQRGAQLLSPEMIAEREDLIRKISSVTSTGVVADWGHGIAAYLAPTEGGGHDVVFEVPRRKPDANNRTVLGSILIEDHRGLPSELTIELVKLHDELCEQGIDLLPLPLDIETRLSLQWNQKVPLFTGNTPPIWGATRVASWPPTQRLLSRLRLLKSRLPKGGR